MDGVIIPNSKTIGELLNKIYDDSISPGAKKVGIALENALGLVTSITIPFAMMNNYSNHVLQKNIKKFEKKLEEIDETNLIPIQPSIGVPILENLQHMDSEKISDLFTELLKKAADKTTVSQVHPKYIRIIENLSSDEAIILEHIKQNYFFIYNYRIPFINLKATSNINGTYLLPVTLFTNIENEVALLFPENIYLYMDNLCSLGILSENKQNSSIASDETIKPYEKLISSSYIKEIKKNEEKKPEYKVEFIKSYYNITPLGVSFINTSLGE